MNEVIYNGEILRIRIVKSEDYHGWDVDISQFPSPNLTGSYTDWDKMIDDIMPFIAMSMPLQDREKFMEDLNDLR